MSQSQQTEFGSSQFDPFEPDLDTISFTTSHQASSSYHRSGSSFLQPSVPSPIALEAEHFQCFQRVGPGRIGTYFLFDAMNHSNWVDWWLQTDYGSTNTMIPWDSQHGAASETWKQYEQVAHVVSGSPKVMCKRCGLILEHPYGTKKQTSNGKSTEKVNRHGTTTITRHLETAACKKATGIRKQKGVMRGFIQSVYTVLSFFHTTYLYQYQYRVIPKRKHLSRKKTGTINSYNSLPSIDSHSDLSKTHPFVS